MPMTTPDLKKLAEVKRYEPEAAYIGTGEYVGDMRLASDGDYVRYSDYTALLQEVETLRGCDIALKAWQSAFGTTQLTHAKARLEAAESKLARHEEAAPQEGHPNTESCGFDRNASLTEDTYVCTCGYRGDTKP